MECVWPSCCARQPWTDVTASGGISVLVHFPGGAARLSDSVRVTQLNPQQHIARLTGVFCISILSCFAFGGPGCICARVSKI